MAIQLQLRKGTKAQNDAFVGAEGELTYDTQTQGLRIHDGTTQGGHMIDTVVAWQVPTAENNYTWYRKYASGWVEIGGLVSTNSSDSNIINLPITMADTNYQIIAMNEPTDVVNAWGWVYVKRNSKTTTGFMLSSRYGSGQDVSLRARWQVSGVCA